MGILAIIIILFLIDRMRRQTTQSQVLSLTSQEDARHLLEKLQQENEKLKAELKQYSTILNMAPYPIWQRDADLNIRFYNVSYSEIIEDASIEKGDSDRKSVV